MASESRIEAFGPQDFQRIWSEVQPQVGNYNWLFGLLRSRYRKRGHFAWRTYLTLRKLCNSRKPYFVGETLDGVKFVGDYRDWYAMWCALDADYDRPLLKHLQRIAVTTRGAYLDVGTNMGVVATAMAQFLASREEVVAFEPISLTARRAAATMALNGVTNAKLIRCAVSDSDEEISLAFSPDHSEAATPMPGHVLGENWIRETVPCRRLDTLAAMGILGSPGLIKFDVEGHEPAAIRGAKSVIAHCSPAVVFEYNRDAAVEAGWTPQDAASLIGASNPYSFEVLHDDGTVGAFPPSTDKSQIVNILGVRKAVSAAAPEARGPTSAQSTIRGPWSKNSDLEAA